LLAPSPTVTAMAPAGHSQVVVRMEPPVAGAG